MIPEEWEPVFRKITPSKWRSVGKFQSLAARPGSIAGLRISTPSHRVDLGSNRPGTRSLAACSGRSAKEIQQDRQFGRFEYFLRKPPDFRSPGPRSCVAFASGFLASAVVGDRRHFDAGVASVVEHDLAKVGVEGSSPFARSQTSR